MLCETCYGMLRGQTGRQWTGTYDLHFDHQSRNGLLLAAQVGCPICRILIDNLPVSGTNNDRNAVIVTASLSKVTGQYGYYRLDFQIKNLKHMGTFFLKQSDIASESAIYTPIAKSTKSQEVLQLARHWISTCTSPDHPTCPGETFENRQRFYPTRLLELPPYNAKEKDVSEWNVKLVISENFPFQPVQLRRSDTLTSMRRSRLQPDEDALHPRPRGQYVTLSHCWGKQPKVHFDPLLKKNLKELQEDGIPIKKLPQVFRQAVDFARRLRPDIRYIWIDALCIIQDDKDDWATESVRMYEVYRNSFVNISATAASDSSQDIHPPREPQRLWEDQVNVNIDGIPHPLKEGRTEAKILGNVPVVVRCNLQDALFWNRLVDDAPVNRRAWVFQERLLAPRVLHFCGDQVAWECRHLDATESLPYGVLSLTLSASRVVERVSWKRSMPADPQYQGQRIKQNRAVLSLQAHESWKRIVERYSITALTMAKDRLIALAGIAQMTSRQIDDVRFTDKGQQIGEYQLYIAGMWEKWLASQLLWRVNPSYKDKTVHWPQWRPQEYRAPSFSWAAVEAEQGVKCGKTLREDDMWISVSKIHMPNQPSDGPERFGQVHPGCEIELNCTLRPIEIYTPEKARAGTYRWKPLGVKPMANEGKKRQDEFSNLYLDSPRNDDVYFLSRPSQVFCAPAYEDDEGYIICLILRRHESPENTYSRLGILAVAPYESVHRLIRGKPAENKKTKEEQELEKRIRDLEAELKQLKSSFGTHSAGSALDAVAGAEPGDATGAAQEVLAGAEASGANLTTTPVQVVKTGDEQLLSNAVHPPQGFSNHDSSQSGFHQPASVCIRLI